MSAEQKAYPRVGFDHMGIVVSDIDRYVKWYSEAFDLTSDLEFVMGPENNIRGIVLISPDGWRLELFECPGSTPSVREAHPMGQHKTQGITHLCLQASDIQPVFDRLVALGAAVHMEPQIVAGSLDTTTPVDPNLRIAYLSDPEGNLIELLER
ncbi:MAG TPA: VOC family protein [Gaiellaceae bacterium]